MKNEKKTRSSIQISLALIGSVALSSCGEDGTRPIYRDRIDCAKEWSDRDCEEIPADSADRRSGTYYGRFHSGSGGHIGGSGSRSTGFAHVTRGGFGHFSGFHGGGRS
jgi:hypothetical protein